MLSKRSTLETLKKPSSIGITTVRRKREPRHAMLVSPTLRLNAILLDT
jgi:hypothetical protein